MKEYILVEPEAIAIEAFHINEQGFWELREFKNIDDELILPSIGISLALKDIYKRTEVLEQLDNKK